jgi:hypothetical protein
MILIFWKSESIGLRLKKYGGGTLEICLPAFQGELFKNGGYYIFSLDLNVLNI